MEDRVVRLDRFKPRDYQLPLIDAIENKNYKRVIAILPRRAGKDITAFNIMIRAAIRKIGVYYYIFPTYSQAKKALWDSITNDGFRFLDYIPEELLAAKNSQEMKLTFINGSIIQFVGSTDYDRLMGTNPRGCVFSEYALQDPMAYKYIRPILMANEGWALLISCVAPDTLVITADGLKRIKNISNKRSEYSDLNIPIYGLGGFHNAEQFYYGGKQRTIKITLMFGYEIECTPIHPIWNGSQWVKAGDLRVGDDIPVQYGQDIWGKGLNILNEFYFERHDNRNYNELNLDFDSDDFLYLLGLIHADGNYNKNAVCVTKKKDIEIILFLQNLGFKTRPDGMHHEYSSREFCSLLEFIGFKHGARNKTFPNMLFDCTKQQMKSFLQGLFDGDGTSNSNASKRGDIKLTSTCLSFIKDLQIILLNFGIVSSVRSELKEPTNLVKTSSLIYNLEISGYFAQVFYRDIGFRLKRKQKNYAFIPDTVKDEHGNIYPVDASMLEGYNFKKQRVKNKSRISRRLIKNLNKLNPLPYFNELLKENLFYSKIKSIVTSSNDVYDFVIPDTHSFFSNGFISHNTPRGKGPLYELYHMALQSSEWFAYKLTVEDTKHVSKEVLEQEIREGTMSEDLIQQEFYTSFELGVEGGYYTKIMDKLTTAGHITNVPHEVGYKVHTAWDIGMRDSTTIIFFQMIGQTIRIIDCYENSKEGLEHYISVLKKKEYIYGKHIGPHDIRVREFGTGITRFEKARQLGITFSIADNISIEDGIEAVRSALPKMWFDEVKCAPLIKAIANYRQEYDSKRKVYKPFPLHDWSSHFCDSMRYLSISLNKTVDGVSPEELDRRYREAMYGEASDLPRFFR